jgi:hypothetical protein
MAFTVMPEATEVVYSKAVIVYLFSGGTARGHSSGSAASLEAGIDALGTRGDFQRHYSASTGTIDGHVAGPLAFDGEPGNQPEWRLDERPRKTWSSKPRQRDLTPVLRRPVEPAAQNGQSGAAL